MASPQILPPPPFSKIPGEPGVLFDGNSVAWYKNEINTVIKDGANRVSYWLDRLGNKLANLFINYDFTIGWGIQGNAIINNSNTFSTGPGWGSIRYNTNPLLPNTTYLIKITFQATAGANNFRIYDYLNVNSLRLFTPTGGIDSYEFYYTTPAGWNNGISLYLLTAGSTITVFELVAEPITGNHLIQATGANQPLQQSTGILFDGVNDYLKTLVFLYNQPCFIYMVFRQVTWASPDQIFDGNGSISCLVIQSTSAPSPNLEFYGGILLGNNANLPVNTFGIMRVLFNGVNSFLRINNTAPLNGNAGNNNMTGFTLASLGNFTARFSNIEVKEIILRKVADSAAVQNQIYNYLSNQYGI